MADEVLEGARIRKVDKTSRERQKDEEWIRRELGDAGIDVYRRIEGERKFGEIEREVLLLAPGLESVLARMQGRGVISARDSEGKPFEFGEGTAPEGGPVEEKTDAENVEIEETRHRVSEIWGGRGLRIYDSVEGESGLGEISKKAGVPQGEAEKIVREMEKEGVLRLEYGYRGLSGIRPARYILNLGKSSLVAGRFCGGVLSPLVLIEGVARFGLSAVMIYTMLKKGMDAPRMAVGAQIGVEKAGQILSFFEKRGIARLSKAGKKQVSGAFGNKGATIYEKFGAAGLQIYLLYQKGKTPTEIIRQSGVGPKMAVEAIAFINSLYGVKIDRERMKGYERYGIELEQA